MDLGLRDDDGRGFGDLQGQGVAEESGEVRGRRERWRVYVLVLGVLFSQVKVDVSKV